MQSKLPSRIAESYQRGLDDATLLDQRRSIALMESLAEELAERLRDGDTPELRRVAGLMCRDAATLLERDDPKGGLAKVKRLAELLEAGVDADGAREKLFSMADRIGSRRDAAWTTKLQRIQVMNANDVALLFGMLLQRARTFWSEDHARQLAEMLESLLEGASAGPGRGERALAAIPIEGQTVNGGLNGNAAS
jgi:hypothetical protein